MFVFFDIVGTSRPLPKVYGHTQNRDRADNLLGAKISWGAPNHLVAGGGGIRENCNLGIPSFLLRTVCSGHNIRNRPFSSILYTYNTRNFMKKVPTATCVHYGLIDSLH